MSESKKRPLLDNLDRAKPLVKKSVLHNKSLNKEVAEYGKMGRRLLSEILWIMFGIDIG